MNKLNPLSKGAKRALEMLRDNDKGLTMAEMKLQGFEDVNPAHLTALVNRKMVEATKVKLVCECCKAKRTVNEYVLTDKGEFYKGD